MNCSYLFPGSSSRKAIAIAASGFTFLFSGCTGMDRSSPFGPQSPISLNLVSEIEKDLSRPNLLGDPRWADQAGRNQLVREFMFICDIRFTRYKDGLNIGKAVRDTAIDHVIFGLSSATTLGVSPAHAKGLSAATSILTFSRSNIEKNFYHSQALPVLIRKMETLRKEKADQIEERLDLPVEKYPVLAAVTDVLDYYKQGTLFQALESIDQETSLRDFQLKGGTVMPPPRSETRNERYRKGPIKTKTGPIGPFDLPEPVKPDAPTFDSQFGARNLRLKEAFEFLSKDECKAILVEKEAGYQPAENENTRETLALRILTAAGYPIEGGGAVQTLATRRMQAWDEASLKQLETAYSQYLKLPELPVIPTP